VRILRAKEHISGYAAVAAAIGNVNVPIGAAEVVARGEPEYAGSAIDGPRGPFELEEYAGGCFIQVQMEPRELETGAVFLVEEGRAEAEGAQEAWPAGLVADDQLAFEPLLIALAG